MPIEVKDLITIGEVILEAIGDGENDRRVFLAFDLSGKAGVEITPSALWSDRSIKVNEVIAGGRDVEDIVDDPFDLIGRNSEPTSKAVSNIRHSGGNLDLVGPGVWVEELQQQSLEAVTGAEISAHAVGFDPRFSLEDRTQASGVIPIAAGLVQSASFLRCVGCLIHVDVGIEFKKGIFDCFSVAPKRNGFQLLLKLSISRKIRRAVRRTRQNQETQDQACKPVGFGRVAASLNEPAGQFELG